MRKVILFENGQPSGTFLVEAESQAEGIFVKLGLKLHVLRTCLSFHQLRQKMLTEWSN